MRHPRRAAPSPPQAACAAIILLLILSAGVGAASDPLPLVAQGLGALGAPEADLTDLARPLRQLLRASAGTRAQVANAARAHGLAVQGDMVQVVVVFASPADAARVNLADYGAEVQIRADRRVQALVPVGSLGVIAQLAEVATVRRPYYPIPLQLPPQGAPVSEGVQLTNASAFHFQVSPISGLGTTVNIVDIGFIGYTARQTEDNLPLTVGIFDFAQNPPPGGIDNVDVHGTAVAEIVHDMAPGASINLIRALTVMELEQATAFAAGGAHASVMSLGVLTGPFDGTSALAQAVDQAPVNGVLFAIAAGNCAEDHWEGRFIDTDGDGLHEFAAGDEGITVDLVGGSINAYLSWWDTAGQTTAQDYDLVLRNTMGVEVARSAVTQDGDDEPTERLLAFVAPGIYELQIEAFNIDRNQVDLLELFTVNLPLEPAHQVPQSSISMPADAVGAFCVGATRGVSGIGDGLEIDALEIFSSQGPTNDGRMKPDLTAPDFVSSASYGPVAFAGTSSAAPHVGGAVALLKGEDMTRDFATIRTFLLGLAEDLGALGPDNQFGHGRLSLRVGLSQPPPADKIPPVISIIAPINGSLVSSRRPTIVGSLLDDGSGIDEGSIVLSIDNVPQIPPFDFDAATGVLSFTPVVELALGAHVVTLTAADIDGNQGNTATAGFRIALPMLGAGLRIMSLPFTNLLTADPVAIFGRPLSEIAIARWLPDDTAFNKYHIFPDPFASFEPPDAGPFAADPTVLSPPAGLGYFVRLNTELALAISGQPADTSQPYIIKLRRGTTAPLGWNMIGTPFNAPVDLATVEFVADGVTHSLSTAVAVGITNGVLYTFVPDQAGGGFYEFSAPLSGTLEPFVGYWLNVTRDVDIRIFPVIASTAGASEAQRLASVGTAEEDGWRIRLSASAGGHQDPMNFAGVSATASVGADASDIPEPPPITRHVSVYFPHGDWAEAAGNYAQELLPRGRQSLEWPLVAATDLASTDVTLRWDLAGAPRDISFVLTDLDAGNTVGMRTTASYTFTSGAEGGERHFRLRAYRKGGGLLRVTGLRAEPARGSGAALSFDLSSPASVTVEVRNIAGRLVRRLAEGQLTGSGRQTILWDGRGETGAVAAPGVYLCRVAAQMDDGQKASGFTQLYLAR